MTNTNCLENIKCPGCGNEESFRIAATTMATVTDDGVDDHTETEWDDGSYAECGECHRHGTVKDFTVRNGVKSGEAQSAKPIAAAHTPGPWNYDMDFIVAPDPNCKFADIYIAEIAHDDDEGRIAFPEQQDANRKLIAAAPAQAMILDLVQQGLMTLEEGEAEFDGVMHWFDHRQPDWCVGVIDAIGWDTARDAIAQGGEA